MMTAGSLAGLLRVRAQSDRADRVALRCLSGGQWRERTWKQYWSGAQRAAAGLRENGVVSGARVLVLVLDVEPAVLTLFGAWACGAVPVQVGLPFRLTDAGAFIAGLLETARRLDARALVLSRSLVAFAPPGASIQVLVAEDLLDEATDLDDPCIVGSGGERTALIQLTSGSTGHPRGVVISHGRLMRHLDCISRVLPSHEGSEAVSWLPLHHDMGLVGGLLFPFYNGFVANMLSPADFRAQPLLWLEAMARFRATICAGPPSAYAMLLRTAKRAIAARLDLSAWECAMVGAEPIPAEVLRAFVATFSPLGFRERAFFPVYGLAEATVAVTFPTLLAPTRVDLVDRDTLEARGRAVAAAPGPGAIELVGVGRAIPETEVRVVGADGGAKADRHVGEILVRSTTLMNGYYDDPAATANAFADGWLRTGDLGYFADGDLFVTGRSKDVIIRGGLNLLPTAIEDVAEQVAGARPGGVAAVGVYDENVHTQIVCLLVETKLEEDAERADLRWRLDAALKARGIVVDRVTLLAPGRLPRTTSGKLRRRAAASQIVDGTLAPR
jgi:fatty-acyl-CoA synthase